MTGRLLVVSGTGTEIGKTHVSEALLLHLGGAGLRVVGVKPVESGVGTGAVTDSERLARASTFHVKQSGISLRQPVSPHLAARAEGKVLSLESLAELMLAPLVEADLVLAELPGGLFTPLTDTALNADLAARCSPDFLLLVAPDRLGVLHDVLATARAAAAQGLPIGGLVLVTPQDPDPSTGTNADELRRFTSFPILAVLPRATPASLADHPGIRLTAQTIRSAPAGRGPG
jgi:dethiobiotin synthetase